MYVNLRKLSAAKKKIEGGTPPPPGPWPPDATCLKYIWYGYLLSWMLKIQKIYYINCFMQDTRPIFGIFAMWVLEVLIFRPPGGGGGIRASSISRYAYRKRG